MAYLPTLEIFKGIVKLINIRQKNRFYIMLRDKYINILILTSVTLPLFDVVPLNAIPLSCLILTSWVIEYILAKDHLCTFSF